MEETNSEIGHFRTFQTVMRQTITLPLPTV